MEIKNYLGNGFYKDSNNKKHCCNAHLSYKERSVIIDYEWDLHVYDNISEKKDANLVPFEVYPYATDIYVGYAKLDNEFGKVDLTDLISKLEDAIKEEDDVRKFEIESCDFC